MQIRLLAIWGSLIGRWKRVKIRLDGNGIRESPAALAPRGGGGPGAGPPSPVALLHSLGSPVPWWRPPHTLPAAGGGLPHPFSHLPKHWSVSPRRDLVNKSIGLKFL